MKGSRHSLSKTTCSFTFKAASRSCFHGFRTLSVCLPAHVYSYQYIDSLCLGRRANYILSCSAMFRHDRTSMNPIPVLICLLLFLSQRQGQPQSNRLPQLLLTEQRLARSNVHSSDCPSKVLPTTNRNSSSSCFFEHLSHAVTAGESRTVELRNLTSLGTFFRLKVSVTTLPVTSVPEMNVSLGQLKCCVC